MLLDYIDLIKTPIFCENKFTLAYFYKEYSSKQYTFSKVQIQEQVKAN